MRDAGLAEEICETVSRAARMHDEPEPGTDKITIVLKWKAGEYYGRCCY